MEWQEIEVDGRHTVKFTDLPYVPLTSLSQPPDTSDEFIGNKLGGILRHGEWGWLARNSVLQIVSLRNGQTISSYKFCESRGYDSCCIKCVEEILPNNPEIMLLAVVLESFRGPGGGCSYVAVYSVELSKVLHNIELSLHLTCARFMEASVCRRSLLQNFDGCLAVGSEEGVIVLLDLNVCKLTSIQNELHDDNFVQSHIVDYSLPLTEIHRNYRQCQQDGIHFGLQIEVIDSPSAIQCILPIDLILGLAIGLEDGRLALYDLTELQIFYVAPPNPQVAMSSLVKMDFLEPSDDPRPCLFIWTLHENGENLHAVLHSLMYEKRLVDEEDSLTYFETFQAGAVRLQLPLEATNSIALACQAITSVSTNGEDDTNCLCAISWLSVLEGKNKLLIFDLNQWYKEEMPFVLEYGKQPNYLAGYVLSGECCGLQTSLNPINIAHFNSMQRFEEHFYPNSLSFESLLLHKDGCRRYNWEGAQNRVINLLRSSNAAIFLEPNFYFNEIIRTRLMPQFMELNINSTFSRNAKCEVLLSAALEHNCVSLLRDCAKSWIDGSFMGNFSAATGLSLSTLTDWIWKRATCIKSRCNDLCKNLFEFGGYPLDSREQKELGFITRQLKLLAELLKEILVYARKQIPERVFTDLANKQSSLSMASNYQDILLWLLNIGLLPEASSHNDKINANSVLIAYPYQDLKEFYKSKRSFYAKLNESFISKKSGSCKLLFIDSLIEHVCKGNILHEYWLENDGNGLYPPNSLEAMLRVMLVPDLDYDNKCAILLYFFLDLNMAIEEEVYKDVVANFIKFPSVFKLSAPLIKTVQAFWNLDHDHYLSAVDEFISPFNKNQSYPQWQVELLIEVLLNQNAANLALRILESQPSLISPLLKLNTLLANDLISEAFHFVRCKNDDTLLETFYTRCLRNGQFGVIRDLALSDHEGLILQNILKNMKTPGAESLHFVYLLQKSKYIEAVSYMEEMSNRAKGLKTSLIQNTQMDTPNLVLSAFNTTMTPVTQGLTDVYFRIKNKIKKKEIDNQSPVPLSCQLIKQNANSLLGGIYHSSALSAHFATYYWGEMEEQTKQTKHLLSSNNAPFLRRPQIDTNCRNFLNKNNISYPQAYKVTEKRSLIETGLHESEQDEFERQKIEHKLNPKKKRRLIGQEIVDDLSNFMRTNKTLNASEFNFEPKQHMAEELASAQTDSFDLLLPPLASRTKEIDTPKTIQPEIQSILKTSAADSGQRGDPSNEEEKNLRFRLPAIEATTTQLRTEEVAFKEDEQPEESMEKVEEPKSPEISPTSKLFSRSVSVESNRSSSSKSIENFYSPLSSQNNSKLDSSNISRQSILSGPQPRKPLARLSVDRLEKSLTPDRKMQTVDSSQYVTALESNIKTKISPRCALERFNTEAVLCKESSNLAFVTAKETFSEPKQEQQVAQATSDFGGRLSSSQATLTISKIDDFLPKGSSSKVGVAEPVKATEAVKISDCTTVLGSLTTLESISSNSTNNNFALSSATKPSDEQKRHMLETTLSMSTYDVSVSESTSLQQAKSSLMVAEKDTTIKLEIEKEIEITDKESAEQFMCENETKEVKDDDKESSLRLNKEKSNDVFIVLSSSSSSSASTTFEQESEDDHDESDNDYGKDVTEEYDIDTVDYEREEEYEIDNEDYGMGDEYDVDGDENSDTEDQIETDTLEDCMPDDYEEYGLDEDISVENDSDNSSVNENAEFIQLIEDSSSDTNQPHDSDSDDVKVIENEVSPDVIEKKAVAKESEVPENADMDKNTSNTLPVKEGETPPSKTTEKHEEIAPSSGTEVCITEIETETSKPNNAKTSSGHLEEKQAEKQKETGDNLKDKEKPAEAIQLLEILPEKGNQEANEETTQKSASTSQIDAFTIDSTEMKETADETKTLISSPQKSTESLVINELKEESNVSKEPPETKSSVEEKTVENIEQKPETTSEKTESIESLEQSMPSIMEVSNDNSSGKEKTTENIVKKTEITSEKTKTYDTLEEQSIPLSMEESKDESAVKEKTAENIEQKPETTSEKTKNKDSLEKYSLRMEDANEHFPVKERTAENIEKKPETSSEKTENDELLEEQSFSLRMEESNEDSPVKENVENKTETVKDKTANKKSLEGHSLALEVQQNYKNKDSSKEKKTSTNEQKAETSNEAIADKDLLKAQEIEQGFPKQLSKPECIAFQVKNDTVEKANEKIAEISELTAKSRRKEGPETEPDNDSKVLESKTLKSASVLPKELEPRSADADLTPRRTTRGASVPPQAVIEAEESLNVTPRTRRSVRAGSLQPKSKLEDNEMDTPRKSQKLQDNEGSEKRITRGSSVPPGSVEGKITRRRSMLLEAINEDGGVLDSPSTRTRLRSRLNSMESEVDSPAVQQKLSQKRTRHDSITSQPETSASMGTPRSLRARSVQSVQEGEDTSRTSKRKRRDSTTSQPETNASAGTPRSLRSRSVLTVQEDDAESMPTTPKASNKKIQLKRQNNADDQTLAEDNESKEQVSPKTDSLPMSDTTYSSSRRLTRTQLAIMEKSAILMKATTISPPQTQRPKSRAKRSHAANADSDDAGSVSSKLSTVSSVTGTKRRVTRSSVKDKDEVEDDSASIASSLGSEKQLKGRRSKDKNSPNTTLSTIPEDAPIETRKRGRPAKN